MIGVLSTYFFATANSYYLWSRLLFIGAIVLSIRRNINIKNCKIIAIDNSSAMIKRCQEYVYAYKANTPVEIIEGNILDISIENASMVILNFTL